MLLFLSYCLKIFILIVLHCLSGDCILTLKFRITCIFSFNNDIYQLVCAMNEGYFLHTGSFSMGWSKVQALQIIQGRGMCFKSQLLLVYSILSLQKGFCLTHGDGFPTIPMLLQHYKENEMLPKSEYNLGEPYHPLDH